MDLRLTEQAAARIRQVVAERPELVGLRVGLKDGGCSGYAYLLDFERQAEPEDLVIERDGARVLVHPLHAPFLEGSELRFGGDRFQSGFYLENPNVKSVCGCGESFDVGA